MRTIVVHPDVRKRLATNFGAADGTYVALAAGTDENTAKKTKVRPKFNKIDVKYYRLFPI